ncbi:MAG TPA: hypothetical protein PKY10_06225 [Lentisphaeria bacterium]|nr:hypothetical protein [Lentisphaeria bacterium]
MSLNNHLSIWLIVPGQAATPAETIATAGCQSCLGRCDQSLVLIAVLFAAVTLIGILAWTAAFRKLLSLLKAQSQTLSPSQPTSHASETDGATAPSQPNAAITTAAPDSSITAPEAAPAEKPANAPCDLSHLLPDFLCRAEFQDCCAAIFDAGADASHDTKLLLGNLIILNAAVKASERSHYHDSMLETALRGIGTCVANLNRKTNPNQLISDLLTWEKQIQAFLSTTTEYGLRTPMPGEKVDNDWMAAPPRAITVSAVDCWAIYKRDDVVCKALVH